MYILSNFPVNLKLLQEIKSIPLNPPAPTHIAKDKAIENISTLPRSTVFTTLIAELHLLILICCCSPVYHPVLKRIFRINSSLGVNRHQSIVILATKQNYPLHLFSFF